MDQTLACPLQTTHPSSSQVALLGHCTLKPLQAWPSNHALVAHFLRSRQQETPQPTHQHSTASHQSCILASSIGVPGAHGSMSRGPQRCAVGLSGALATKTPMCSTDGVFVPAGVVQVCPAHTSPPAGAAPLEGCHNNPTHCTVSEGCVRLGIGRMGACIPLWMLPLLPSPACPYIKPQQPELPKQHGLRCLRLMVHGSCWSCRAFSCRESFQHLLTTGGDSLSPGTARVGPHVACEHRPLRQCCNPPPEPGQTIT